MVRVIKLALLACWLPLAAFAQDTLLTVTTNGESKAYTRADLEALGPLEFTTTTIWTEGDQTFTGTPLSALLVDASISEGTIRATAINDYAVEIPVDEVIDSEWPIVAFLANGEAMSVREKGPLWIVYPYDADPAFRSEVVYSRSIWQLDRISLNP